MYASAAVPDVGNAIAERIRSVTDLEAIIKARQIENGVSRYQLVIQTPISVLRYTVDVIAGWLTIDGELDDAKISLIQRLLVTGTAWIAEA